MFKQTKIIIGLFLFLSMLNSYAIQVSVQASSSDVAALGFTVNGKNHGGAGHSYTGNNMPAGTYIFGLRVGGLFGKDVSCYSGGKKAVTLNKDTTAVLNYNAGKCVAKIYSR